MDSSILTFSNHGCRGEYNIGQETDFDEFTVSSKVMPDEIRGKKSAEFSPMIDRHLFHHPVQTLEDISAGDELLDNYIFFTSVEVDWEADIIALRKECSGAAGDVRNYERKHVQ